MTDTIRNFQTLTTRAGDVLPPKTAIALDRVLKGLEAQYDRDHVLELLHAFKVHLTAEGSEAHDNLIIGGDSVDAFVALLAEKYNEITTNPLTEVVFRSLFEDQPVLQLELMRRIGLNGLNLIEGVGQVPDDTNPYTAEGIVLTPGVVTSPVTIIDSDMAEVLFYLADSGSSYYKPLDAAKLSLGLTGVVVLSFSGLSKVPNQDRPILTLKSASGDLDIVQRSTMRASFRAFTYKDMALQEATVDYTAFDSDRLNVMIEYRPAGFSISVLDENDDILTVNNSLVLRSYAWTALHVHTKVVAARERSGFADLRRIMLYNQPLSEVERKYILASV